MSAREAMDYAFQAARSSLQELLGRRALLDQRAFLKPQIDTLEGLVRDQVMVSFQVYMNWYATADMVLREIDTSLANLGMSDAARDALLRTAGKTIGALKLAADRVADHPAPPASPREPLPIYEEPVEIVRTPSAARPPAARPDGTPGVVDDPGGSFRRIW